MGWKDLTAGRTFDLAYSLVSKYEGGYVNDPDDPGGETKYGITKRDHPDLDIANLTREQAKAIYRQEYWHDPKFDMIAPPLGFLCFECGVNQGPARATKFLQQAIGVTADGAIGPKTIEASRKDVDMAINEFCVLRNLHYASLSTFGKYGKGWSRRFIEAHQWADRITTGILF